MPDRPRTPQPSGWSSGTIPLPLKVVMTGAETRSAEKLIDLLVDVGGAQLLSSYTQFDPKLFHAAGS